MRQNPSIRAHPGSDTSLAELCPVLVTVSALVVCLQNVPIRAPTFRALDMFRDDVECADLGDEVSLLLPSFLGQRLDHARRTFTM